MNLLSRQMGVAALGLCNLTATLAAPTLALAPRPPGAPTGTELAQQLASVELLAREHEIFQQVTAGNVPEFLRRFCPVQVTNVAVGKTNSGIFFVMPDYLALGRADDYLLMPMTPGTAQRIADALACALPTPKMVDAIFAAAEVKLTPTPIPPSPAMTTLAVFAQHNDIVRTQRMAQLAAHPHGTLVAGHKKDVVISARLAAATNQVALYGWHRPNGEPIQPLYTGHTAAWVDYSHGIRLVHQMMEVNGQPTKISDVLADPKLAGLISDEGVLTRARYPISDVAAPVPEQRLAPWPAGFVPGSFPGELTRELRLPHDVRIVINTPATNRFAIQQPVLLVFYATPNGNTIEQTLGKRLRPGDDWHFDVQHLAAQTRFLRQTLTNQNVVLACLENALQSWPAWRKKYGDTPIPAMIAAVKSLFTQSRVDVVLSGHSGGGSWAFGCLNTVTEIPREIVRIAFLDSNYAYETARHADKLARWLKASETHHLCVLAYHDSVALLNGQPFVSERGGTWGRSHAMLADLENRFRFTSRTNGGLRLHFALDGRIQFWLKENPDRKILHTVQVERNGFIHALLCGTPLEGQGYEYLGPRAYEPWVAAE